MEWLAAALAPSVRAAGGSVRPFLTSEDQMLAWAARQASKVARSVGRTYMVAFGLSLPMMASLAAAQVPLLDLEIHPARFGRDLFLRSRTNSEAISRVLASVARAEDELWIDAALRLGHHAVFGGGGRFGPNTRIALFVGQARMDAALISGGRAVEPADHLARIQEIARAHDFLFIRPHPYEPDRGHLEPLLDNIPNAALITDQTYDMLCESAVETVVGLSSSVILEAKYFGKRAIKLIESDNSTEAMSVIFGEEWRIGAECFEPAFWRAVFASTSLPATKPSPTGSLRSSYGRGWGIEIPASSGPVPGVQAGSIIGQYGLHEVVPALLAGWHATESTAVWSSGSKAWIGVRVPEDAQAVELHVRDFIAQWRPGTAFSFRELATRPAAPVRVMLSPERSQVRMPLGRRTDNDLVVIECACSRPFCSFAEGYLPPDKRTLGVALEAIGVM